MGEHVLQECMSSGWHIFKDVCLTGMHFLQEDTPYLRICL